MSIRLAKLKDNIKKFFSKTYPNIEFTYELKDAGGELLKISCNLQTETIEDILVNVHVNTFGAISLEATFGEIDKEDVNVLTLLNEYNANEPVAKVYADDFLNLCLGAAGIEEDEAIKTINTMLDYFSACLDDEAFITLLDCTY